MSNLWRKFSELFAQQRPHEDMPHMPPQEVANESILPRRDPERDPVVHRNVPVSPERSFSLQTKEKTTKQSLPFDVDYEMEFIRFVDRNTPNGFSQKFMAMLPYLELSFLSWPAYWLWRGYRWQSKRSTEQLGLYIHRTYQNAKLIQLGILTTGLLAVTMARAVVPMPVGVSKVDYQHSAAANNGHLELSEQPQGTVAADAEGSTEP